MAYRAALPELTVVGRNNKQTHCICNGAVGLLNVLLVATATDCAFVEKLIAWDNPPAKHVGTLTTADDKIWGAAVFYLLKPLHFHSGIDG